MFFYKDAQVVDFSYLVANNVQNEISVCANHCKGRKNL